MTALQGTTIVFDLDGTLVDTAPDLIRATDHVLAAIGLGPADAAMMRDRISFGARRMIVDALAGHGHVLQDTEVDRLHSLFISHYEANIAHSSRPYRDALETLVSLRGQGAGLAVCTNKKESLARALLVALDIDGYFDAVAGLDTFAVCKPHPGHILETIRAAGGDPRRAVMVGDSENDIKAARAADIPVIGCLFGYSGVPMRDLAPDAVIGGYTELNGVIHGLLARRPA